MAFRKDYAESLDTEINRVIDILRNNAKVYVKDLASSNRDNTIEENKVFHQGLNCFILKLLRIALSQHTSQVRLK